VECKPNEFVSIVDIANRYIKRLEQSQPFNRLLQITFQINSLLFTSAWQGIFDSRNQYGSSVAKSKLEFARNIWTICWSLRQNTEM